MYFKIWKLESRRKQKETKVTNLQVVRATRPQLSNTSFTVPFCWQRISCYEINWNNFYMCYYNWPLGQAKGF